MEGREREEERNREGGERMGEGKRKRSKAREEKKPESSLVFIRALIPSWGLHLHDLISSKVPSF